MRSLLISANKEKINMVSLPVGLALVAAATEEAGHGVRFLDLLDNQANLASVIEEFNPQVIGVSVRNIDNQTMDQPKFLLDEVKEVVDQCRAVSKAPIVLGGAGYSLFPETALEFLQADMGIQGDGEFVFPMLLNQLEKKADLSDTPGLYIRGKGLQGQRAFEKNLDRIPTPHAYLKPVPTDDTLWLPLQTTRGCPMDCSYCPNAIIEGRRIRRRSPKKVIQDISRFMEKGFNRFFIIDSTFNLPPSHAKEVCQEIINNGLHIKWRAIIYPGLIEEELVELMARAGCVEASVGSESGCESILKQYNKRFTPDDVRHTSRLLKKHGIKRMGFLLLGAPGETKHTIKESFSFTDSLNLESVKISPGIRIYPNTQMARHALSQGIISEKDDLLYPKFFMAEGLSQWLTPFMKKWMKERPHWIF